MIVRLNEEDHKTHVANIMNNQTNDMIYVFVYENGDVGILKKIIRGDPYVVFAITKIFNSLYLTSETREDHMIDRTSRIHVQDNYESELTDLFGRAGHVLVLENFWDLIDGDFTKKVDTFMDV